MEKPLPGLPGPSSRIPKPIRTGSTLNLTALSIEARYHLRNVVFHALKEEESVPESDRDEWVNVIESVLAELGERISIGGWLPGLRRLKCRKRNKREVAKRTESSESKRSKDEEQVKTSHTPDSTHGTKDDPGPPRGTDGSIPDKHTYENNLATLRRVVARPFAPVPKPTSKHLLLIVAPLGIAPSQSTDDMGYELVRYHLSCTFTPGVFLLPEEDTEGAEGSDRCLYGVNEWDDRILESEDLLQIIGGTFFFRGVSGEHQHVALMRVLKVAIYTHLSIILEQHILSNSHVSLRFPKPLLSPTSPVAAPGQGTVVTRALSTSHVGHKPKQDSNSGLWNFFAKKKDALLQRTTPSLTRTGSLELQLPLVRKRTRERQADTSYSPGGLGSSPRTRRFSFISDFRPSFMQPPKESEVTDLPFNATVGRIEKFKDVLSTSPGITIRPPALLSALAEREKADPERRLGGDEKTALSSLLGWEGKNSRGKGMAGITGFVRHQCLCVLYSEHIPVPKNSSRPPTPPDSSSTASTPTPPTTPDAKPSHCGRIGRWKTFRYYAREPGADEALGDTIWKLCSRADEPCEEPSCQFKRGEHELRYIHGGIRISVCVSPISDPDGEDFNLNEELPEMWESCGVCGKRTQKERMLDGTYLYSFAKYLELLVYSPLMSSLTPPLCEHTSLPPRPWSSVDTPLPQSRLNIVRNFSYQGHQVSFTSSPVADVFEVRVPRLQIFRSRNNDKPEEVQSLPPEHEKPADEDRKVLRREIMKWWQGLSEHMDELEGNFINERSVTYHKTLPRLPSSDEAYDSFYDDGLATPRGQPSALPPLPPNTPLTPIARPIKQNAYPFPSRADEGDTRSHTTLGVDAEGNHQVISQNSEADSVVRLSTEADRDSLNRLTSLRHTFQKTEQDLYAELSRTATTSLNDIRRSFVSAAKGATRRLNAWETKHAGHLSTDTAISDVEPEWWQDGCHALPGGNIIVREDDWGSIISFTLGSSDYQKELLNMSTIPTLRSNNVPTAPPPTPAVTRPSFFGKGSSSRWFSPVSTPQLDPDQEGVVWHEPETYSAVISRREHPRDPTSLLKLGEVLRQKTLPDIVGMPGSSKFPSLGSGGSRSGSFGVPPTAWAKAEVRISKEAADGLVSVAPGESADKILHELEAVSDSPVATIRSRRNSQSDGSLSSSGFFEANIRRGKASSIISTDSDATTTGEYNSVDHSTPPPLPPKDRDSHQSQPSTSITISSEPSTPPASHSSLTATFTTTFSSALKYMLKPGQPPTPPAKHHHGLLYPGSPAIDDKPHIKYDWTVGKRLKFSCTVYYAKQFDALRKRCGIEDVFLHSLARSENWMAEGGKSRSNFWKTTDNKFIIKTLVNAWNVADLQVLIDLGPAYFRYMDSTVSKPTVLAKLLGFYTVEIKNLETGNTQSKADLLVMENLFYDQNVIKTFDLKGIQGRKVKAASNPSGSKTLFDGEWIEGQQRALTLVQPYSKAILQEAIKSDCEFLAKSNIMDYSLLVGIDEDRKQIACGLVDTIGSYTFAKTLEYKAKQGLNSGKEVTVVPPHEYQERFVNAMINYFVACPDKWSRPMDDTRIPSDYKQLPSVL